VQRACGAGGSRTLTRLLGTDSKSSALWNSVPYYLLLYSFRDTLYLAGLRPSQALHSVKSAGLSQATCLWTQSSGP
jgi:hypothetical protein